MNLTYLKVARNKVIHEVATLCGKELNQLSTRTTVDETVDNKSSLAKKTPTIYMCRCTYNIQM